MTDISVILTAHREGLMAGPSLKSLLDAVKVGRQAGIDIEILAILDDPDEATRLVFADAAELGIKLGTVDFRDQGKVRNHAVAMTAGRLIAFLDGDDLWSENWLTEAYQVSTSSTKGKGVIAHPETDWFFDSGSFVFFHADQEDPAFKPEILRIENYWDSLCMAPRSAYLDHPFCDRDVAGGFAYEDWHWNCETLHAGYVHKVVPDTIHFKRRRPGSQTILASTNRCLTPPTPLMLYSWDSSEQARPPRAHGSDGDDITFVSHI